jgi:hypothetical protein
MILPEAVSCLLTTDNRQLTTIYTFFVRLSDAIVSERITYENKKTPGRQSLASVVVVGLVTSTCPQ